MPVDGVGQARHERRGGIEPRDGLAEVIERGGLCVQPLHSREVGPDRLVHGSNARGLLTTQEVREGLQRLLKGRHTPSMARVPLRLNPGLR